MESRDSEGGSLCVCQQLVHFNGRSLHRSVLAGCHVHGFAWACASCRNHVHAKPWTCTRQANRCSGPSPINSRQNRRAPRPRLRVGMFWASPPASGVDRGTSSSAATAPLTSTAGRPPRAASCPCGGGRPGPAAGSSTSDRRGPSSRRRTGRWPVCRTGGRNDPSAGRRAPRSNVAFRFAKRRDFPRRRQILPAGSPAFRGAKSDVAHAWPQSFRWLLKLTGEINPRLGEGD